MRAAARLLTAARRPANRRGMRSPAHAIAIALAVGASFLAPGCGTTAEISRDERELDDAAFESRADHDELVRAAGDLEGAPAEGEACSDACRRHARVSTLTERICGVSARDDHDEATDFLCEDARERRASTERRAAACPCS